MIGFYICCMCTRGNIISKIILICLVFSFIGKSWAKAQSNKALEVETILLLSKAGLDSALMTQNEDSIFYYASLFGRQVNELIQRETTTLEFPFTRIKKQGLYIATSPDKNLRIYSWDTYGGGSMHFFDEVFQYRSGKKILTRTANKEEGHPGGYFSEIHEVHVNGRTVYLVIENRIFSGRDVMQSVQAFVIENDVLRDDVKLFRTKNRTLNRINVNYNFFSVVDRPERPIEMIKYDEANKKLFIAVVDGTGTVSDHFLVYTLNGYYFEYTGVEKK